VALLFYVLALTSTVGRRNMAAGILARTYEERKAFMQRRCWAVCLPLVCCLIALSGCNDAPQDGEAEAERDIRAGKLYIKAAGLPASYFDEYAQLLHDRLRVELVLVAGCQVDSALENYLKAYNGRVEREVARRFGPNAISDIRKEAAQLHRMKKP
jgi:hypothetical protein